MQRFADFVAIVLVAAVFAGGHLAVKAQSPALPPDPVLGTWKLNLSKSKYATPPPKSLTVTITPAVRGYRFSIDSVGPDDQPQKWWYESAFDGSESPVIGNASIDTVVASSSGSSTTVRYKKGGQVITATTSTVSDDGRSLLVTIKIPLPEGREITSTAVYDRQ